MSASDRMVERYPDLEGELRQACADLEQRLRRGEDCRAEHYLAAHPAWEQNIDLAADLIYAEFLARMEQGQQNLAAGFYERFPAWKGYLEQQFAVHDWLRQSTPPVEAAAHPESSATWQPGTAAAEPPSGTQLEPATRPPEGPDHYELLGELATGGMGIVFKARQLGLNRLVALKMLKAESVSRDELNRFRSEAEIIARLQHPHIVQIYEIGEWRGRPFLALEYVAGGSLAQLLKYGPLPPHDAAHLLEATARAVHLAHENGILHRDIKPGNILLQRPNAECRMPNEPPLDAVHGDGIFAATIPKVTDFGLAKRLDDVEPHTRTGAVVGTPAYMAPEQVTGQRQAVGPVTDVYALGVVLYECLTGRPPFQAAHLLDLFEDIALQEPVPPTRLQPKLPRDLETICLKCLRKEPERRYASAAELAQDLGRFLLGEAIQARPVGAPERFMRWCRRNPVVAGLGAALAVSLLGGLIGMTLLYFQAEHRREQAEIERGNAEQARIKEQQAAQVAERRKQEAEAASRKAEEEGADYIAVAQFLLEHLLNPPENYPNRKEITLLAAVDAAAPKVEQVCKGRPLVEASLHHNLGETYRVLAAYDKAEHHLQRALQLRLQHLGAEHRKTNSSLHNLVNLMVNRGKHKEAEPLYRKLLEHMRAADGPTHDRTLIVQNNLASVLEALARFEEAAVLLEEVCHIRRESLGLEHTSTQTVVHNLANLQQKRGKLAESEKLLDELLSVLHRQLPEDHPRLLAARSQLALLKCYRRDFSAAVVLFRQIGPIQEGRLGREHPDALLTQNNLGAALTHIGELEEAEKVLLATLPLHEKKMGATHPQTLSVLQNLGAIYRERREWPATEAYLRRAFDGRSKRYRANHPDLLQTQFGLGMALYQLGKFEEAEPLLKDFIAKAQDVPKWPHSQLLEAINMLGDACTMQGKYAFAEKLLLQAEAVMRQNSQEALLPLRRDNYQHLIRLYQQWKKPAEAEKMEKQLKALPARVL